jgi:hypothetical protein
MTTDSQLKNALRFYIPLSKEAEALIWAKQKARRYDSPDVPDDERVEDAGLLDDADSVPNARNPRQMVLAI